MFVCDKCLKKKFTNHPSLSRSYGRCECCSRTADCSDIPSSFLVRKRRVRRSS